jgi:hypothetical protein
LYGKCGKNECATEKKVNFDDSEILIKEKKFRNIQYDCEDKEYIDIFSDTFM